VAQGITCRLQVGSPYRDGMPTAGIRPYVLMLCGCAWFTAMALLTQSLGEQGVQWQVVALARSGLAFVFALAVALATKTPLVLLRPRVLWLRSIAGSFSMVFTFYALTHTSASDVLIITNTFPIWVAMLAWPLAGERPTAGVWLAIGCAVTGVSVALNPQAESFRWLPSLCAFAASFFTAVAMLGLNRLHGVAALAVVVHFSGVSTLFCLAAWLIFDHGSGWTGLETLPTTLQLLGVGVTATIGQVFLTRAFVTGSPTRVSVTGLSQVAMVLACEAALGWKVVGLQNLLGTALVIGPTAWLMARERWKKTNDPPMEEVAIE
jgi:drug/metabolite transporter (DMT)-like permease